MGKLMIAFAVATVLFAAAPLLAQTQVTGQGAKTIAETTEEPPPRTIIPGQKAPSGPPQAVEQRPAQTYATPPYQPTYQPRSGTTYGSSGYGSAKCDLPGACEAAAPPGTVTLEQFDARKGGAPAAPKPKKEAPPPAAAPAPAQAQAGAAAEPIYESSADKPIIMKHYVPGVSDKMPTYPAAAPAPAYPAPAPTYAAPAYPAPTYPPPAPAPAPRVAAPAAPPPSYGPPKCDLPGACDVAPPPGAVRLEDVGSRGAGYVPPQQKTVQPQAPAVQSQQPAGQVDQFEEIGPSDVQKPPSRWK